MYGPSAAENDAPRAPTVLKLLAMSFILLLTGEKYSPEMNQTS